METENIPYGFPDPLASNEEKLTDEYGLKVARSIGVEWFNNGIIQVDCGYHRRKDWINKMREYSRGRQGVGYYQDLISREDEDINFLNLDWRPSNTAGKFVNLVANGINEKNHRLVVTAIDRLSADMKVDYREELEKEMYGQEIVENTKKAWGIDLSSGGFVPRDEDELDIHMSMSYKPKQEIAEELLINYVFDINEWYDTKEQCDRDLVESGLAVVECYTDKTNGITLNYVDIENYVHSYINDNNGFKDKYYDGVVRTITISEFRRLSNATDKEVRDVIRRYASRNHFSLYRDNENINIEDCLDHKIDVLDYTYKTTKKIVYKKKHNNKGGFKLSQKESTFDAPKSPKYETQSKILDTWFEGSWVIGSDFVYNWKESENVVNDKLNRAQSRFITRATNIYKNNLHSFLSDIIPEVDQIHLTKLKLQHIIAEIKPSGAEIDWDMVAAMAEGDKKKQQEIIALFSAKGIVFKKRITDEFGNVKEGRAVEELHNGIPANLLHLLQILQHQNQSLRETTGINPSRDGTQSGDILVGVQQAQIMASNTITEHIVKASKYLKLKTAEVISTRIADIFRFKEAKDLQKIYEKAIGKLNIDVLKDIGTIHLHEFGFKLELLPTMEENARFEETMKVALQAGRIDEDDVNEAREIAKTSPKYASQFLKVRKRKRQEEAMKQKAMEAQIKSQNDIAAGNAASQNRMREKQFDARLEIEKAKALAAIEAQKAHTLNQINAPVRQEEYQLEVFEKQLDTAATMNLAKYKEEKKDERQDKNNTDHSKMIEQRRTDTGPIDFTDEDRLRELLGEYLN